MSAYSSVIREYLHLGGIYYHEIDLRDDIVVVKDFDNKVLAIFDSSCNMFDVRQLSRSSLEGVLSKRIKHNMKPIGKLSLNSDEHWEFMYQDGRVIKTPFTIDQAEGVLNAEIEVVKDWLTTIDLEDTITD